MLMDVRYGEKSCGKAVEPSCVPQRLLLLLCKEIVADYSLKLVALPVYKYSGEVS